MLTLEFDGLFRGAPQEMHLSEDAGFMCYGWVILRNGVTIARGHGGYARSQEASSNVAEYLALIEGLEALLDMRATNERIVICGDAKSIIEQMEGKANASASSIRGLHRRAMKLSRQFKNLYWSWTPRRYNHTADALTRRALRQIRSNPSQYETAFLSIESGRKATRRLLPLLDLRLFNAGMAVL